MHCSLLYRCAWGSHIATNLFKWAFCFDYRRENPQWKLRSTMQQIFPYFYLFFLLQISRNRCTVLVNLMIMCKGTVNTYIKQVIFNQKNNFIVSEILLSYCNRGWILMCGRPDDEEDFFIATSTFLCFFLRLERTSSLPLILVASATFPRASTLSWLALTSRLHSTLRMVCGWAPLASRIPGSGPAMWSQTQTLWWVHRKGSSKDVCDCMKS